MTRSRRTRRPPGLSKSRSRRRTAPAQGKRRSRQSEHVSRSCRPIVGEKKLEVLSIGCLKPDPRRLGHMAVQEGDARGGLGVRGLVGPHEDGPVPGPALRAPTTFPSHIPPRPAAKHRAGRLGVLADPPRTERETCHPSIARFGPATKPSSDIVKRQSAFSRRGRPLGVIHRRLLGSGWRSAQP